MSDSKRGSVVWFNQKKGYGFIKPEDNTGDVFVHYSGIINTDGEKFKNLEKGQIVDFEVGSNDRGKTAINVKVVEITKEV